MWGRVCTLSNSADGRKLGGGVDMPEHRAAIYRDLNRLETGTDRNLMSFNRENYKVLHQGTCNPRHQDAL